MATVLVYSDDRTVRRDVRYALGSKLPGGIAIDVVEAATAPAALNYLDQGTIDLAIFDGEATPAGGMGLARQIKDEIDDCPPVLLLVARADDAWLATWSGAEAIGYHPVDPIELPKAAAALLA
jgi:DNA-binding response OmpR family regulator